MVSTLIALAIALISAAQGANVPVQLRTEALQTAYVALQYAENSTATSTPLVGSIIPTGSQPIATPSPAFVPQPYSPVSPQQQIINAQTAQNIKNKFAAEIDPLQAQLTQDQDALNNVYQTSLQECKATGYCLDEGAGFDNINTAKLDNEISGLQSQIDALQSQMAEELIGM